MPDFMSYYKESYEDSRQSFLNLAQSLHVELRSHTVGELSFESIHFPPVSGNKKKLLILTSGIHGIEGFTGSALQRYFIEVNFFGLKQDDLGILVIHGINPYGFKHELRVTENNIDLNRNFDVSEELFKNENAGYSKVYDFLNPRKPYSKFAFYSGALTNILKHGMDNLRKAILRGQYQFPNGIFFGGKEFEPQVRLIQDELSRSAEGYSEVLLIDLHTGYGKRSKLHLFGDRSPFIDQSYMNQVFKGMQVDYGQEKDFYAVTGGFTVFLAKLFHNKARFAGVVFEFGTIDSHKTKGSLESLYRMINKDKTLFREMFYPSSSEWRKAVMEQFHNDLRKILLNWV